MYNKTSKNQWISGVFRVDRNTIFGSNGLNCTVIYLKSYRHTKIKSIKIIVL